MDENEQNSTQWKLLIASRWRQGAKIVYENRKTGETGFVSSYTEDCMLLWDTFKYFFEPKDYDLGI